MKKLLIVANWKMNKIKDEAKNYLEEFLPLVKDAKSDIVIAPSFALLDYMQAKLKGTGIELSSQNMFFAPTGAFTGEVSADMLKDFDVKYVILGHSERRQYFLETDSFINKKVISALSNGLKPIICVGETIVQKKADLSKEIVKEQLSIILEGVTEKDVENIVIAYEPIWAIGTGFAMNASEANEMAEYIIKLVQTLLQTTKKVKVLYGGSVNEDNASEFFNAASISGALVGGASLDAKKFAKIILG